MHEEKLPVGRLPSRFPLTGFFYMLDFLATAIQHSQELFFIFSFFLCRSLWEAAAT
jgi:hypothetical protein